MLKKTEMLESIKKIKNGSKDSMGNLITDVLALGNEYAIYEIDTKDINKKLRLYIDGIDDESENIITQNYIKVKEKYIIAKGLLYRSSNFGLMKSRVAHTLATALSGEPDNANAQFDNLISQINKEYSDSFTRRLFYVIPGYILLTIVAIIFFMDCYLPEICLNERALDWLKVAAASVIGGVFSITVNLPKIRFESEIGKTIFVAFGLERITISMLAGIICTIGIKARFIFANMFDSSTTNSSTTWTLMFIVIVAAFSENLVPNIMNKFSDNKQWQEDK